MYLFLGGTGLREGTLSPKSLLLSEAARLHGHPLGWVTCSEGEEPVSRAPQKGAPSVQAEPFTNFQTETKPDQSKQKSKQSYSVCAAGMPGSPGTRPHTGFPETAQVASSSHQWLAWPWNKLPSFSPRMQKTPVTMIFSRHQYKDSRSDYKLLPHELESRKQILILSQSDHLRGELPRASSTA